MGRLDGVARARAESEIAKRAQAYYPGSRVSARIGSARFLWPLLVRGTVSDIEIVLEDADVVAGSVALRLRRLAIDLHEVRVDRRRLWKLEVGLRTLGSGRMEVEIDGPSLAAALGLPIVFHDDEVEVRPGIGLLAISARGALSVENNVITFRPGRVQGFPLLVSMDFEIPVPTSPLWPRAAEARSIEGALVVTGALDELPPGLTAPGA